MRGRPLHHIALGTPRVEVLAAFYEEALDSNVYAPIRTVQTSCGRFGYEATQSF